VGEKRLTRCSLGYSVRMGGIPADAGDKDGVKGSEGLDRRQRGVLGGGTLRVVDRGKTSLFGWDERRGECKKGQWRFLSYLGRE